MRQDGLIYGWSSSGIQNTRDENLRDGPQSPSVRTSAIEDRSPGAGLIGATELPAHKSVFRQIRVSETCLFGAVPGDW